MIDGYFGLSNSSDRGRDEPDSGYRGSGLRIASFREVEGRPSIVIQLP